MKRQASRHLIVVGGANDFEGPVTAINRSLGKADWTVPGGLVTQRSVPWSHQLQQPPYGPTIGDLRQEDLLGCSSDQSQVTMKAPPGNPPLPLPEEQRTA